MTMVQNARSSSDSWPAPVALGPVHARVVLPGSKSVTNRALVLAALADGPATIRGALMARDSVLMVTALTQLGTRIEQISQDPQTLNADLRVIPASIQQRKDASSLPTSAAINIDVGLAGTIMRFLPAAAALHAGTISMDGDPRSRQRPLGPMLSALTQLGVDIDSANGCLPLTIHGRAHVPGGAATIDASSSSQFVTGLLLSAARFDQGLQLTHSGSHLPSRPHIDMTLHMLAEHSVSVLESGPTRAPTWQVLPGPIKAIDRTIEPDLSNAAAFLAAAMVTGGEITIADWPTQTTQAGDALRDLLSRMGATVTRLGTDLHLQGPRTIRALDADLGEVGELAPVLAALCALAEGPSRLHGIGHLRGHETDRIAALIDLITTLGGDARELSDGLQIQPRPLHGTVVDSYQDHRMATAAAVLGLQVPGIEIINIATTAKTLPDFPRMWNTMLAARPG